MTATPYLTSPTGSSAAEGPSPYSEACGGGQAPTEVLSAAQTSPANWLNSEQISCGEGFKEVCEVIEKYEKCLSAATTRAQSQDPFTFSNGAQSIGSDGASWLENSETVAVRDIGRVAGFGLQVLGVASTILDIASAYDSCT